MVSIVLRRLLRRFGRAVAQKRAIFLLLSLVGLVGVGGLLATQLFTLSDRPDLPLQMPGSAVEPPATERYLKGNQTYNAEMIWGAYSEAAQEQFTSQGGSLDAIRRQLQAARERGSKIEGFEYIGGRQVQSGGSIEFYLVTVTSGQTQGQRQFVPYVFTLDAAGKIDRVQ